MDHLKKHIYGMENVEFDSVNVKITESKINTIKISKSNLVTSPNANGKNIFTNSLS